MKVIAVMGSPRKGGNVDTMMKSAIRGALDAGHQVKEYVINELNIMGCQGCRVCKDTGVDCIRQDDLRPYWKELHEAGALILGAPNYCSQVCGPMITYMNRHYCLLDGQWKCRLHPGVKLIGLFSQNQPDKEKYLDNYKWYLADFQNRDMVLHGMLVQSAREKPAAQDTALLQKAYELGRTL